MDILAINGIEKKIMLSGFLLGPISLQVAKGRRVAITGETGSGKSTLLRIVAGLIQPCKGTVLFEGSRVLGPDEQLLPGHPAVAYLPQDHELRNNYRMEELMEAANKIPDDEAANIYRLCRIAHLMTRKNYQLSGGEKQRMALARLLISSPKLLMLDEPFSNLDLIHKQLLVDVINDICRKLEITCILTSHDPKDTLSWADEVVVMRAGKVVQQGTPENVYHFPADEYVGAIFGTYNLLTEADAGKIGVEVPPGKRVFIRPQQLRLSTETGTPALVIDSVFSGSTYELTLRVDNVILRVLVTNLGIGTGQIVRVVTDSSLLWFLPLENAGDNIENQPYADLTPDTFIIQ